MASNAARWDVVVSTETDEALRQFLASEQGEHKEDLSSFVEEAVRERIFDLTVRAIRSENAARTPEEIDELVEEAIAWARSK